jgi:hypothetical protein
MGLLLRLQAALYFVFFYCPKLGLQPKTFAESNLLPLLCLGKRHAMVNYCPANLSELQTTARNKLKSAPSALRSSPLDGL